MSDRECTLEWCDNKECEEARASLQTIEAQLEMFRRMPEWARDLMISVNRALDGLAEATGRLDRIASVEGWEEMLRRAEDASDRSGELLRRDIELRSREYQRRAKHEEELEREYESLRAIRWRLEKRAAALSIGEAKLAVARRELKKEQRKGSK